MRLKSNNLSAEALESPTEYGRSRPARPTPGLWAKFKAGSIRGWHVFKEETHQRPNETREEYRKRMRFFYGPMILPLIVYGGLCAILTISWGEAGFKYFSLLLGGNWIYFLPGAGKEVAIPLMVGGGIHPALVAATVVFLDNNVSFFMAFNFAYIEKFPIVDRFVRVFLQGCEKMLGQRKLLRRFSFLGLVFFVMIPFEGAGGIGGTLLGMVIGLGRLRTWLAILIGTSIASFSMAYSAEAAKQFLSKLRYGGYVTLFFFVFIIIYSIYKERKAIREPEQEPPVTSEH
jgi:uncharacterized membrane protein